MKYQAEEVLNKPDRAGRLKLPVLESSDIQSDTNPQHNFPEMFLPNDQAWVADQSRIHQCRLDEEALKPPITPIGYCSRVEPPHIALDRLKAT